MAEIWICNPFDNLPEEGASPQRYSQLATELARRGNSVTWWSSDFSHQKKARRTSPEGEAIPYDYVRDDGVRMRLVPTPPYSSNVSLTRIMSHRAFARMWFAESSKAVAFDGQRKPDLIVVSSPPLSTFATASAIRKHCGAKIALDLMDAWPDAFKGVIPLPARLRPLAYKLLFAGARRTVRKAHCGANLITSTSNRYLELARENGAEAPMAAFRHSCQAIHRPDFARKEDLLRIVYIGNMGPSYDIATAISAVRTLAGRGFGVRLDLAGSGPDEQKLKQMANGCDAIRFHGFLGADELTQLLSNADAGLIPLFPSSGVAIPYKLPDYSSHGIVSLSCLDGESRDLIESHDAGMTYTAQRPESLCDAIISLNRTPGRLQAMREGALRLAEKEFLASSIYPKFADFLEGNLTKAK